MAEDSDLSRAGRRLHQTHIECASTSTVTAVTLDPEILRPGGISAFPSPFRALQGEGGRA
jgi:hypothetical protein